MASSISLPIDNPTFYVYVHKRADDGSVFYVGKGSGSRRWKDRHGRNIHWKRIVKKHGFIAEIVYDNIPEEEAFSLEKSMIAQYGTINKKNGRLCNMSEGGEGPSGIYPSEETKRKIIKSLTGKRRTEEQRANLSKVQKEVWSKVDPEVRVARGKAHSEKMKGRPAHNKGKKVSAELSLKIRAGKLASTTSTTKGYSKDASGKYVAQIKVFGKSYHVGNFNQPEQASDAYNWCQEQLQQFGQVDISRFRRDKNKPIIIKGSI
jgi:hypothetical protein